MIPSNNTGAANRDRQEENEESTPQHHKATPGEDKLKQEHDGEKKKEGDDEKFGPGQADNYDPEEFNTD